MGYLPVSMCAFPSSFHLHSNSRHSIFSPGAGYVFCAGLILIGHALGGYASHDVDYMCFGIYQLMQWNEKLTAANETSTCGGERMKSHVGTLAFIKYEVLGPVIVVVVIEMNV